MRRPTKCLSGGLCARQKFRNFRPYCASMVHRTKIGPSEAPRTSNDEGARTGADPLLDATPCAPRAFPPFPLT